MSGQAQTSPEAAASAVADSGGDRNGQDGVGDRAGEPQRLGFKLPRGQRSRHCSPLGDGMPRHPPPGYHHATAPVLQLLQGVGVIELLEQDERPTFIIDLANTANFSPGPLQIVFANASLRAAPLVSDLLSADTGDPAHSRDFSRFKAWIVSSVKGNESIDVCLPSLSYGGINWTCSTLRRRFRFVSGNVSAVSITPTSPSRIAHASSSSVLDQRARTLAPPPPRVAVAKHGSPPAGEDGYFGDGQLPPLPHQPNLRHVRSHSKLRSRSESDLYPIIHQGDALALPPEEPHQALDPKFHLDWTEVPLDTPDLPSHIRFARSVDWAATPLGPVESWPPDLRSFSNMIMNSSRPAAMYWGRDFVTIYNEAYVALAGQKHPKLMGMRYRDAWAEVWDQVAPAFDGAWSRCQATMRHEDRFFVTRNGYLEETFFNWSIVPLVGSDGSVVALYNSAIESTRRKVNERRTRALHEVGDKTSQARDVKAFWAQVRSGLASNEYDIPFALIYSVSPEHGVDDPHVDGRDGDIDHDDDHDTHLARRLVGGAAKIPRRVVLEGSLGVAPDHPVAVPVIDPNSADAGGFAPYIRESLAHLANPVVLRREDGTLPDGLVDGVAWRGFGDPCRTVVVFPVHPTATAGEAVVGFVVLGINPRRPYDDDYELFVNILSRQLVTSLASVVLFEEEIKRGERAARLAALDRQELSTQLRLRTQEAVESEGRFTRMAAFAPVGMFIADGHGSINYCNDMWWEISRHPRSANTVNVWMHSIRDEDRPGVEAVWARLVNDKVAVTHEFRFKCRRHAADGHPVDTWVLMSAYPEKDDAGCLKSIFGCMTDISRQKWAEGFEKQRREEAVELKRQQENFIDITSHEMRNPLSAILQCSDEVSSSLIKFRAGDHSAYAHDDLPHLLDNCIEAANTISLCANHQKRIVDDVLTLSKLDSQLLLVTPVDAQPVVVVENVLRMFETELKSHDIRGEFRIDKSYLDLDVHWYKLDPSRLRQVMINLMTNAIKFTQGRDRREIVISLAASRDVSQSGFSYFPTRRRDATALDPTDEPDWGSGDKINLHLAVTDTGPGLDEDTKKLLFRRFSQASPRTHVQYGGSGLGLFICRTLTELQGGQIGVSSQKGVGSTFAFYIRTRTAQPPKPSPGALSLDSNSQADAATDSADSSPPPPPPPPTDAVTDVAANTVINSATDSATDAAVDATAATPEVTKLQYSTKSDPETSQSPRMVSSNVQMARSFPPDANVPPPLDILIVEDNLVNQKVLQRQLRISGNNTHVANHGGEALEALRRSRFWAGRTTRSASVSSTALNSSTDTPITTATNITAESTEGAEKTAGTEDAAEEMAESTTSSSLLPQPPPSTDDGRNEMNISVILMDLEMPVMDGMTCAREIRKLELGGVLSRHVPIIAVTAYARPEQIASAKEAGIDDVISKPFRIPELIPKIKELVAQYNTFPLSPTLPLRSDNASPSSYLSLGA